MDIPWKRSRGDAAAATWTFGRNPARARRYDRLLGERATLDLSKDLVAAAALQTASDKPEGVDAETWRQELQRRDAATKLPPVKDAEPSPRPQRPPPPDSSSDSDD